MVVLILIILFSYLAIYLFMHSMRFGSPPSPGQLRRIQQSPNYWDGQFQNQHATPALSEGTGYFSILKKFFFDKHERRTPSVPIPSTKTNLLNLDPDKNIMVWFGHSSYFMQLNRKTILVDPVFSGNASPLRFTTRSFAGTDRYDVDDLPFIDFLFLTHDHWDHLDYRTIIKLKTKVNRIITGLGVGAHLRRWGIQSDTIKEMDWYEQYNPDTGFFVNNLPARHFSGRGFKRNGTIWSSFVLTTPDKKIYIGGDSGYDSHFSEIGKTFGPFDLVILENGQYNEDWKYIHMNPEETVQAAIDLRARYILPVHWGKFALSVHPWDEPIRRISKEAERRNLKLLHPRIGEAVDLDRQPAFDLWWEGIS
jgi:L-ascorbate metabolism protein UlaG (beta-lactamase superfamily)